MEPNAKGVVPEKTLFFAGQAASGARFTSSFFPVPGCMSPMTGMYYNSRQTSVVSRHT